MRELSVSDGTQSRMSRSNPLFFKGMLPVWKLLRPHQYIKNSFVFIGPLFAHQWSLVTMLHAFWAFFAFCCIASAVYILNDIVDIEADREHPVKRNRPIASGAVSLAQAKRLLIELTILSLILSSLVSFWVVIFVLMYLFLNILYSWRLKHIVILDVFIISSGFMLRILSGTIGLYIEPSQWLLLCGLMVTLLLGFSKRRAELLVLEGAGSNGILTRRVLDDYNPAMLDQFIAVTAACTILSYGLYTVAPSTIELHDTKNLVYTLPFVVYGILRYLFLLHFRKKGQDTAKDLLTDKHMLVTVFAWAGVTFGILA